MILIALIALQNQLGTQWAALERLPFHVQSRLVPRTGNAPLHSGRLGSYIISDDGAVAGEKSDWFRIVDLATGEAEGDLHVNAVVPSGNLAKLAMVSSNQPHSGGLRTSLKGWSKSEGMLVGMSSRTKWLVASSAVKFKPHQIYAFLGPVVVSEPPREGSGAAVPISMSMAVVDAAFDELGRSVFALKERRGARFEISRVVIERGRASTFRRPNPLGQWDTRFDYSAAHDVMVVTSREKTIVYKGGKLVRALRTPASNPEHVFYLGGFVVWQYASSLRVEGSAESVEGSVQAVSGNRKHALIKRRADGSMWLLSTR